MTQEQPPADDAQQAADRVAELIAEGSMLARGWAERFARRREGDTTDPVPASGAAAASPPAPSPAASTAPDQAGTVRAADLQDAVYESPTPMDPPGANGGSVPADAPGAVPVPDAPPAGATSGPDAPARGPVPEPPDAAGAGAAGQDVDALAGALRATVAQRLGVPSARVRVTVSLEDAAAGDVPTAGLAGTRATPRNHDTPVAAEVVVPVPLVPEGDPIEAFTTTLDDLAARARNRLAEELGTRLPDIVAEIRFPAGGRPSVRIRPSARGTTASTGTTGTAGAADIEAVLRRLLLGRDGR